MNEEFENEKTMNEDFAKWMQSNATMYKGNNAADCMQAAFLAGAAAMREKAAEVAEKWRGDDGVSCGDRLFIAAAIRKLEV